MNKILTYTLLAAGFIALAGIGMVSANGGSWQGAEERMERIKAHHAATFAERASALGLNAEELKAELAAGKTCPEIAEEQGVDPEQLRQQMGELRSEHVEERLDQMVADGKITQEQADERYEAIKEHPRGKPFRLGDFHGKGGRSNR